jgi:polyketide cyclase/dehydrase/lipid transport protein
MSVITCAVDIAAPAAALFSLSQDYNRRLRWDPFLREARLLDGAQSAAVGVRAWCVAHNGLGMETTYVSFQPPTVVAVNMTRGPRIISSFAGSWRFTELPSQSGSRSESTRTRVVFRYQIAGRPRWLAFLLDPLLAAIIRRETQRRLFALKRVVEMTSILADSATEPSTGGLTPEFTNASRHSTSSTARTGQEQGDIYG